MKIEELIKKIESEVQKGKEEERSNEGLLKLQEIASQYEGEYKLVWSGEIKDKLKNEPKKKIYKTKIKQLDELIDGFREQQLIIGVADSGHGKTAFSLFLTKNFEELKPVFVALEQGAEELIEQRQENGQFTPDFLTPSKLAGSITTDWIEERIVEGIAKHNTKFVVIDHLGYIDDFGEGGKYKRENTAYRIGKVMKDLKGIAKRWNVIIYLSVHISQHDEGQPPNRKDIKNSSDIIQECDTALFLWRKNEVVDKMRVYENETLISVQKNRRTGRNSHFGLIFDNKTGGYRPDNQWLNSLEDEWHKQENAGEDDFKNDV